MAQVVTSLLAEMDACGLRVYLHEPFAAWMARMDAGSAHSLVDLRQDQGLSMAISLGGDGALLDTVAWVGRAGLPVLGINLGRLGFLSSVHLENAKAALAALAQGGFTLEERSLVELVNEGQPFGEMNFALNEISVHKRDTSSMITLHAHLNGRFLNTYWADGLIVATPTGSTAYSLSCGGPLVDPSSRTLVITPISPHNLNVRPFVIPDHVEVRLQVETRSDNYLVNLDSRGMTLNDRSDLVIRRAPYTARLVRMAGFDLLDTLRAKLAWGMDIRSGPGPIGGND
ncbi:MAG: NAD kinase [Flavobacteriales bacterium]|nr:NAD kinase [Flavobacteriales bacterium]